MEQFHEDMEKIRDSAQSAAMAQDATAKHTKEATHDLEHELKQILHGIAREIVAGDDALRVELPSASGIGFVIAHKNASDSQQFAVSATCKPNMVTLNVTDGNWEEVQGVMGNWAHWTDEKQVYSGELNEQRIHRCVEQQFLRWYKGVVGQPPQ